MCMRNWFESKEEGCITPELFKLILDQCVPYSIKLNWRGEPMLNKGLVYMIKYAKKKGVHEVSFNTNGLLLTQENITQLANSGLDWLIISVDGATKATYEKIRIGGSFEKLVKNIMMADMIFSQVKNSPKIRLQICKQPLNAHEIPLWRSFFRRFADQLRVGRLFNPQGKGSQDVEQPDTCYQPWQRMTIAWNGDIYPCPSDYLGSYKLGNINDTTIYEAWHSQAFNFLRTRLSSCGRGMTPLCYNCSSYC